MRTQTTITRIASRLGVPEGGKDYALGDTFPHEANMDLLDGVSFSKGCFVGQEVVSRMQHRGTARKRVVHRRGRRSPARPVPRSRPAPATIGTVGSVAGTRGAGARCASTGRRRQRKGER